MALDDWTNSAPSVLGAAMTGYSCFAFPAAISLALLQGTVISDPAQMTHAGDRHDAQAEWAASTKAQIDQAVAKVSTAWQGKDKDAFIEANVESYRRACDDTAKVCRAASDSLKSLGQVYMTAGMVSFTIGGIMLSCAVALAGTWWLPGANVAVEAAGTAAAETSSVAMRGILAKLSMLIAKAVTILKSVKGFLGLAAIAFGGAWAEGSMLKSSKAMPVVWPDVTPVPGTP